LDQYLTTLDGYITAYNTNANGRVYKKDVDKYNTQIFSASINQMKMTKNLGIFWPTEIYKSKKNTDPPKAKLIKAKVEGKLMTGIVLDENEHGYPINTYRMENVCIDEVSRQTKIGDTADEWEENQMDRRYMAAQGKVLGVSVCKRRPNDKEDGETLKIEAPEVKRPKNTDSDSDVDFMALVPGPSIQPLKKIHAEDEKGGEDAETT
jgi:hypothetical protein